MGVWVKLRAVKHIEQQGRMRRFHPGDWVEVGRQTARTWIAEGEAIWLDDQNRPQAIIPDKHRGPATLYPPGAFPEPIVGAGKRPNVTLFTIPHAWKGEHAVMQENALRSWLRLKPRPEVILFCDDEGIREVARRYKCRYVPEVKRGESGTPRVDDVFQQAQALAQNDLLCYVNSDIILMSDFMSALAVVAARLKTFLMVGRRWNLDIEGRLFYPAGWEDALREQVELEGRLYSISGVDYFAFTRGLYGEIPPFLVGRWGWDNWLVADPLGRGKTVVDASEVVMAVHHGEAAGKGLYPTDERAHNRALYDERTSPYLGHIFEAPWVLTPQGMLVRRSRWAT